MFLQLTNSASAKKMVVTFGLTLGGNDWWWAFDNLEISAGVLAPAIGQQPAALSVEQGLEGSFTEPLSYQWYRGSTPVGVNSSTLTIASVQPSDAGDYTVAITNAVGWAVSVPAALTVLPAVKVTGQWDFNSGDLRPTIGAALTNFDATVQADTQFGTTTSFGIADIAGAPAKVLYYAPSTSPWGGYIMPDGAAPNGGGSYVNRFTIIYDLYYPASSDGTWRCLLQSNTGNSNDGDFFINTGNGIGIGGNYTGTVLPDTWNRVVAVFNLNIQSLKKYINGTLVGTQSIDGVDGRWSLDPTALLFADEDGETHPGYVNSIQFRNGPMTDAQVAALGGVTTDGIPIPVEPAERPSISSITLAGMSVTIAWPGAPNLKLQQNSVLSPTGWTDVPDSQGKSSMTLQASGSAGFFRLAQ